MTAYLRLTDAEWEAILPHLPRQRSGPRRQNDRETVTAFLFAQAAGVSLDCLPDCGFPNPLSLRTTWQRWRARGELDAVLRAGQPAQERMQRRYEHRIRNLSLRPRRVDRPLTIGHRSKTMPRWSHVRGA
jgi:transposase